MEQDETNIIIGMNPLEGNGQTSKPKIRQMFVKMDMTSDLQLDLPNAVRVEGAASDRFSSQSSWE
jgi:hypothetical protein